MSSLIRTKRFTMILLKNVEKSSGKKHNKSYKKFMELFKNIEQNGFIQKEPIDIEIMPDGSRRLRDGAHRVAILRYLKRDVDLEVRVVEYHPTWETRSPGYVLNSPALKTQAKCSDFIKKCIIVQFLKVINHDFNKNTLISVRGSEIVIYKDES